MHVVLHGEFSVVRDEQHRAKVIEEIMTGLRHESTGRWADPGEHAVVMFSDREHSGVGADWPSNGLQVAVNLATGFGGLIWYGDEPVRGVFLSDNPVPPQQDPRVVADPGAPTFHDARSTLPLESIRLALQAFCSDANGARPDVVRWVPGHLDGRRVGGSDG